MDKRIALLCSMILVAFLLAGCISPTPEATGIITNSVPDSTQTQTVLKTKQDINCPFATISPADTENELLRISGEVTSEQEFSLSKATDVRFYWIQSTKDNFELSVVNLDPALENNVEKTTILETYVGPSSGCVDATLQAGSYKIVVDIVNGAWQVWGDEIKYR